MDRRPSFSKFLFLFAMWALPIIIGVALLSLVPAYIKSWLVPTVLAVTGFFWVRNWWQERKVRLARERRAIHIEWLHELSEDYFNGRRRSENLPYLVKDIESKYELYAADFPDLDDRLAEARLALEQPTPAEDLARLNAALDEEALRLGAPSNKSRLR